jgi:ubiquinone/menaquinone biosynthesis methyltransferase
MASEFFQPGEERAARVQELFARVASRYDLLNDLQSFGLHRWWKRRLVRLAEPRPGGRALDLCCGTGDLGLGLARHGMQAVGLDFNERMLAVATGKNRQSGNTRLALVCADAQRVPFADDTFDVVTVGYGLRNLADW